MIIDSQPLHPSQVRVQVWRAVGGREEVRQTGRKGWIHGGRQGGKERGREGTNTRLVLACNITAGIHTCFPYCFLAY